MRSVLYGIDVYDAPTIVGVMVTVLSVMLFAATVPVLPIARFDPAQTLRDEEDVSHRSLSLFHR